MYTLTLATNVHSHSVVFRLCLAHGSKSESFSRALTMRGVEAHSHEGTNAQLAPSPVVLLLTSLYQLCHSRIICASQYLVAIFGGKTCTGYSRKYSNSLHIISGLIPSSTLFFSSFVSVSVKFL